MILGFGMMRLPFKEDWTDVDLEKTKKLVDEYMKYGKPYIDTGYTYHNGASEDAIGELISKRYDRGKFLLCDKLPIYDTKTMKKYTCDEIFQMQLDKCGVDYFDFYFLHALGKNSYSKTYFKFLNGVKERGLAEHIGFSYHDTPEFLDKVLTEHPEMEYVQLQLNVVDWEDSFYRAKECYEVAKSHGKKIIIMEPLKGQFFKKSKNPLFKEKHDFAELAFRFLGELDNVEIILSGMEKLTHIRKNIKLFNNGLKPLTKEEWKIIKKIMDFSKENKEMLCTGCGYCLKACPQGIDIPKFMLWDTKQKKYGLNGDLLLAGRNIARRNQVCILCKKCESVCPQKLMIQETVRNSQDKIWESEL